MRPQNEEAGRCSPVLTPFSNLRLHQAKPLKEAVFVPADPSFRDPAVFKVIDQNASPCDAFVRRLGEVQVLAEMV